MVEEFQRKKHVKIFILSIKAGGTGLNLTAANHVIHYDLWWNPAVEAQATDRAFRIGQQKNVLVHRLISKGTFEEKINQMLQDKKHLADLTVSAGEKWIGDLSNSELKELVNINA
jgi:SNF2 family DNA or RNA helicase